MQLVTDKVTMYDTMKDRRIGIPEVIEKFGVPPEKVVEVQALAGDSTDNVPGVPGIGVKTAAQLIVEYGDLETLLAARRRDQAAEAARGADRECREGADFAAAGAARRQGRARRAARRTRGARARCAQADRVPEGDGVLHADPPRRRVFADRSGRCRGGCGATRARRARVARRASARKPPRGHRRSLRRGAQPAAPASQERPAPTSRTRPRASRARRSRSPPPAPKRHGRLPVDRSKYQTIRSLDELKAWIARVHDVGHVAIEAKASSIDPMQAEICGIALALGAERRLLYPARPQAVRRRRRPVRRRPRAGPDQGRRRARGAEAAAGIAGHPQDRLQHQVQRRDVRAARHHHAQPSTTRS